MEGLLICEKCGAKVQATSYDEAASKIDHSIGQVISKPCSGNCLDQVWYPDKDDPSTGIRVASVTLNPRLTQKSEPKKKTGPTKSKDEQEE